MQQTDKWQLNKLHSPMKTMQYCWKPRGKKLMRQSWRVFILLFRVKTSVISSKYSYIINKNYKNWKHRICIVWIRMHYAGHYLGNSLGFIRQHRYVWIRIVVGLKAPLISNIWTDFTESTSLFSCCIIDGGRGAQVKGRVGVWEVYCACEFWNGIMQGGCCCF